eukprot:2917233-Karenia_brevis.AAC.1
MGHMGRNCRSKGKGKGSVAGGKGGGGPPNYGGKGAGGVTPGATGVQRKRTPGVKGAPVGVPGFK